jgi:hypothetical protein
MWVASPQGTASLFWHRLQVQLMADIYAADYTLGPRAQAEVGIESLICIFPFFLRDFEEVMNLDARDL